MASVHDVAAAILERTGSISTFKLQKLVYYSQAWHLVWDEKPLFESPIEAWANGPVCRDLYNIHSGDFLVAEWPLGNAKKLSKSELETVEVIVEDYGRLSGLQLSELTHAERPWRDAREGLATGERGSVEITHAAMAEYYGSLLEEEDTSDVKDIAIDNPSI